MKQAHHWTVWALALLACASHAQQVRKPVAQKGVDLDAAASATAALYAAPATPAAAPAARALSPQSVRTAPMPARTARPSPLLPPPAAEPAPAMAEAATSAAPQSTDDVWAGAYHCEQAQKVSLRPGAAPDQVELQWKNQRWQLTRVDSRSGAMRLEDAAARVVWIQLGNKSMLLDQRQGKRLLDECQHDVQVETAARMRNNPPPALFDTTGMGR